MPVPDALNGESRVDSVLAEYLRALDRGEAPPRDQFLAVHADLADELADFLDDLGHFGLLTTPRMAGDETPDTHQTITFNGMPSSIEIDGQVHVPDYTLLDELARGGMGIVYRCHDPALHRDLAIKVLQTQFMSRPDIVRRFLEEARIAGQLQHPGIVPVHAVGQTEDGRPCFTMKLVRGRTFGELLSERPDPEDDLPRFLKVFEQIAQTMAFAHSAGVIHRDLKPGNVMVGAFGEVQVMDWGLAKQIQSAEVALSDEAGPPQLRDATRAGAIIGTPSYMSPEQARGETDRLDERADVFGLGAILCEVLTGKPPYDGADRLAVCLNAQSGALAASFARLDTCGVEEDLRNLAKHCLAPELTDRPRHAGEVSGAFTSYLTGVQDRLRQAEIDRTAAEVRAKAAVRARRLGIALAVSIMGLFTIGVGGWFWIDRDKALRLAANAQSLNDRTKRGEDELNRALELREEARTAGGEDVGKWAEALAAAKRAEGFIASDELGGELSQRVAALVAELGGEKRDRELLEQLREARLQSAEVDGDKFDTKAAAPAYAAAFRGVGVEESMTPEAIAAILGGRPVSEHFAAALFDWSRLHADTDVRMRLARAADSTDPNAERVGLRSALAKRDLPRLRESAASLNVATTSPLSIRLLADVLARPASTKTKGKLPDQKDVAEDLAAAIALLRKGQTHYPQDFWINHQLAYHMLQTQPPQLDDAIRFYTAAVSIYNRSPGAYLNLGFALGRKQRFDEAIEAVSECLRLKPDYAKGHGNLVSYLLSKNQPDLALEKARIGVTRNATSSITRTALGRALIAKQQYEEAAVQLQTATRLDRTYRLAWTNLGWVYDQLNKTDEAIVAMQEAMKLENRVVEDQLLLGRLLGKKDRVDEALEWLQKAKNARPQDVQIQTAINDVWNRKNRKTSDTIPFLREAVARNPQDAQSLVKLAHLEIEAGDTRPGLTHLGMAQGLRPTDGSIRHQIGLVYMKLNNHEFAVKTLVDAVKMLPDAPEVQLDLGRAQMNAGLLDEAAGTFNAAAAKRPNDPWAYHHLSFVYERRGEYAEALKAHDQAVARANGVAGYTVRRGEDIQHIKQQLALSEKIGAVIAGKEKLQPDSLIPFAKICVVQQKFISATRFFQEAFAAQPPMANRMSELRSMAAASAFRAGLGQGTEGKTLGDAERQSHRKVAHEWLSTELAAMETQYAQANENEFFNLQQTFNAWWNDLFGDHFQDLGVLPASERERWHQLVEKANDLAQRARTKK